LIVHNQFLPFIKKSAICNKKMFDVIKTFNYYKRKMSKGKELFIKKHDFCEVYNISLLYVSI